MMLFKDYSKKSLWNLSIIGLYIILIYLPDITRYKNIVMGLIGATALWYLVRDFKTICKIFKNNLSFSLLFLLLVIGYSIVISVEPSISIKEINKPILNGLLLFSITFPIVLYKEKPADIAKLILSSFIIALTLLMITNLIQYYIELKSNNYPFTPRSQYLYREFAYSFLFFFPVLLFFWIQKESLKIITWIILIVFSSIFLFLILGTMTRSAWLAMCIITIITFLISKKTKLLFLCCCMIFSFFIILININPNNHIIKIQNKLTRIDSGDRFHHGTQGSALDLILEQPIKGYGYGNQLYHNVYNEKVKDYPNWKFKKSIGPHNIFLAFWFAGGILGLLGILYFCSSMIAQGIQLIRKNQGIIRQASLVLLMSFLGVYVLRGLFENAYINQVGILVGLMLALRHALLNNQSVTPSEKQQ
ncbi:O-antigen ligase RfaL [Enterobacteriaceae bacterium TYF_5]